MGVINFAINIDEEDQEGLEGNEDHAALNSIRALSSIIKSDIG